MRKLMHVSFAAVLLSTAVTGCFISRKETVREPRSNTTIERHSTTEVVPGDTEVRTRTRVERDY
jgi:hypothetical protein